AAGVVDDCDVVEVGELPEGFRYLGNRATTATTATAAATTKATPVLQTPTTGTTKRPSKIKAFFKKLVSPKMWFRRPSPPTPQTTSTSPPPPPPPVSLDKELPPLPLPVPPPPHSSESVGCQWETIDFENATDTPVLVLPPHTSTPNARSTPASTPLVSVQSFFQRLRA
ncbi:hypothetical protein H0H93_002597, partial [Arthromyces matolae]